MINNGGPGSPDNDYPRARAAQGTTDQAFEARPPYDSLPPYGSPPPPTDGPSAGGVMSRRWFWPVVAGVGGLVLGAVIGSGGGPGDEAVRASPEYEAVVVERDDVRAELDAASAALEEATAEKASLADQEDQLADLEDELDAAAEAIAAREDDVEARENAVEDSENAVQAREDAVADAEADAESEADRSEPDAPPADSLDPRFGTCREALANGYGHYVSGIDPEYDWYRDADSDGIVCE